MCLLTGGGPYRFDEGVVRCSLSGFLLGFEVGAEDGYVLSGLVFSFLKALLAFGLNGGYVLVCLVMCGLKALFAVISDVGQVDIEVLEGGDASLFVECCGLSFTYLHGLIFSPGFKVSGFAFNIFHNTRIHFKRGGFEFTTTSITWLNTKEHLSCTHSMISLLKSWAYLFRIKVIAASVIWLQVRSCACQCLGVTSI